MGDGKAMHHHKRSSTTIYNYIFIITKNKKMMQENGANPDENFTLAEGSSSQRSGGTGHYLYTESNEGSKNNILVYELQHNGSLQLTGSTPSGGAGMGKPLGSQGALALSVDNNWLYAVNAGSNTVSSFKVNHNGSLALAHTANACGLMPVSVAVHNNLLYVLNYGSDNVSGSRQL